MSGTPRWRWLKRWLPQASSRSTRGVHRSAKISAALATGQNWPYPFIPSRVRTARGPGKSIFRAFRPPDRRAILTATQEVPYDYQNRARDRSRPPHGTR
jgi:hypothetical protein